MSVGIDPLRFAPLVGRAAELRELYTKVCLDQVPVLCVTGPSGVGKTALANHFANTVGTDGNRFNRAWVQALYRASWTSALTSMRSRFNLAPQNATVSEIEDRLLFHVGSNPTLVVLDNADEGNISEVVKFTGKWISSRLAQTSSRSSLIITAQPQVADQIPLTIARLNLTGLASDAAILDLLTDLSDRFPERDLLELGRLVDGNPQKILFLNWIHSANFADLKERASNLQRGDDQHTIEDIIERARIPALFLTALGVHRSFTVTDELLASLWDHFGSRGSGAYVRTRQALLNLRIIQPIREYTYHLHESVHVQLEKSLLHRVGAGGLDYFHQYFAEYYESALRTEVTTTNLTHFIHHSLAAKNYPLALRLVVDGAAARALATRGAAVLVRQELEKLDTAECLARTTNLQEASLYLRLGGLCNDLSDHTATLDYMERARQALAEVGREDAKFRELHRQIWYYSAVSYSNLGRSDNCLQEYFKIVDSCVSPLDELACLSLGYLAHDLKYRDLALATELGELSLRWANESAHIGVVPKNACSYAETLVVAGRLPEAIELFRRASTQARALENNRELGRIESNLGLALAIQGEDDAPEHLEIGRQSSESVGDRRRQSQALLFTGVARYLRGEHADGRRLISQAASLLALLGDGRYFIPALCWTLQTHGHSPAHYPATDNEKAVDAEARSGMSGLIAHAQSHPEFEVYHTFWWRHLSAILAT